MVFIGSRRRLVLLSLVFRDAWISFVIRYNRYPKHTPLSELVEALSVLESETVSLSNSGDFPSYITSLRIQIKKMIQIVNSSDFNKNKNILKPEIKSTKALITLTAGSKLNKSRRLFLQTSAITAAGAIAGTSLSGCTTSSFTIRKEFPQTIVYQDEILTILNEEEVLAQGDIAFSPLELILDKILFLAIVVINNGKMKPIIIPLDLLQKIKNPSLILEGYFVGFFVVTNKLINSLNLNQELFPKETAVFTYKGRINIEYRSSRTTGSLLNSKYFVGLFGTDNILSLVEDQSNSFYLLCNSLPTTSMFLGNPISDKEENILIFSYNSHHFGLLIKQKTFQPLQIVDLTSRDSNDDILFTYVGNRPHRILGMPRIQDKLRAIANGLYNVERVFKINLLDEIQIVDWEIHNASANADPRCIKIYSELLFRGSLNSLQLSTEHEALHLWTYFSGYTEKIAIRNYYCDILELPFNQRQAIVKNGFIPFFGFFRGKGTDFFNFINESNFISFSEGHSRDNIWEFVTTFVHALMYIDRLEANIMKVDQQKRQYILDTFLRGTIVFMEVSPIHYQPFFKNCSARTKAVMSKVF